MTKKTLNKEIEPIIEAAPKIKRKKATAKKTTAKKKVAKNESPKRKEREPTIWEEIKHFWNG